MKEGIDFDFFLMFFHINIQQVSVPTGSEDFGVSALRIRSFVPIMLSYLKCI